MYFLRTLALIVLTASLFGCAAIEHPKLIDDNVLPLDALTTKIKCELHEAIADNIKHRKWLETWQGQYVITLKANQIAYLKLATSTFPVVLPPASLLNVGVGAGYTSTANRTAILKYNISFKDIAKQPSCYVPLRPDGHPFLTGEIGFREWIDRAIAGSDNQDVKSSAQKLSSIGHTFEFMVDMNGAVSPSFVIGPMPSTLINPTGSLQRIEDNIVDVSFGKIPSETLNTTDIQKVLSASNKQIIAELEKLNRELSDKIAGKQDKLKKPEYAKALMLEQQRKALTTSMSTMSMMVSGLPKERYEKAAQDLKKNTEEISNNPVFSEALSLNREIDELKAASAKNDEIIRKTRQERDEVRVTQRVSQAPAVAISPENNSNVANTLLQLQLERLVTSRLPGQ